MPAVKKAAAGGSGGSISNGKGGLGGVDGASSDQSRNQQRRQKAASSSALSSKAASSKRKEDKMDVDAQAGRPSAKTAGEKAGAGKKKDASKVAQGSVQASSNGKPKEKRASAVEEEREELPWSSLVEGSSSKQPLVFTRDAE